MPAVELHFIKCSIHLFDIVRRVCDKEKKPLVADGASPCLLNPIDTHIVRETNDNVNSRRRRTDSGRCVMFFPCSHWNVVHITRNRFINNNKTSLFSSLFLLIFLAKTPSKVPNIRGGIVYARLSIVEA